jgi:hypothetical protein
MKWFLSIVFGGLILVASMSYFSPSNIETVSLPVGVNVSEVISEPLPIVQELPTRHLISGVPFTVQAPFAEWYDPIFQDACEEASIIMAEAWVERTVLTRAIAKERITKLASHQKKQYGHSVDTGIDDTAKLLREVLGVDTSSVKRGIEIRDIQDVVSEDQIVIVPTDGRKLGNPNFKAPGPPRHMLVIVGYDRETHEFIVNDPGTRRGEGFRYPETVLYGAILDYPTGKHATATSKDKVMLMVWRPDGDALQK